MGNKYKVYDIDQEIYRKMLGYLRLCDRFTLVEPMADTEDYPSTLPEPKDKLREWMLERNRVTQWPGTKIYVRNKRDMAVQHFYQSNIKSFDVLMQYQDFYAYEDQMDIAFYHHGKCVLYCVSHEEIVAIDKNYWGNFFDDLDCELVSMRSDRWI